jgi:hypothetical protein
VPPPFPGISADRDAHWASIVDLTQRMLDEARDERWAEIAELDTQRRRALEAFFTPAVPAAEASAVAQRVRWVLEVDKEILAMGRSAREGLQAKMSGMAQRRRVNAAYTDNM